MGAYAIIMTIIAAILLVLFMLWLYRRWKKDKAKQAAAKPLKTMDDMKAETSTMAAPPATAKPSAKEEESKHADAEVGFIPAQRNGSARRYHRCGDVAN
jgi:cbb3-type cytochrome oxidase subunit 3